MSNTKDRPLLVNPNPFGIARARALRDSQRDSVPKPRVARNELPWVAVFIPRSRDPSDVLDHATSEMAIGSKLGIDATKKLPGEGFKRPWPPFIRMDAAVKAKVEKLFGGMA